MSNLNSINRQDIAKVSNAIRLAIGQYDQSFGKWLNVSRNKCCAMGATIAQKHDSIEATELARQGAKQGVYEFARNWYENPLLFDLPALNPLTNQYADDCSHHDESQTMHLNLFSYVIHLNDCCKMTFEQIADQLDKL